MKFYLLIVFCFIFVMKTFSQQEKNIVQLDFNIKNDFVIVTYEIVKASDKPMYNISFALKTSTGKTITPKSVTGDIGNNIKPGKNKKIIWNAVKDGVVIDNEDCWIELTAQPVIETQKQTATKNTTETGIGNALLLSTALPGLGNAKIKGGGPYWLVGVAAYGCLAGGAFMLLNANTKYNNYKDAVEKTDRDNFYNKAQSASQMGSILLISAGVIWVGDLVWTALQAKKQNKNTSMYKRVFLGYSYDVAQKQPVFMLQYKF